MTAFLAESYAPAKLSAEIHDPLSRFLISEDNGGPMGYSRLLGQDREAGGTVELVRFYMEQRAIGTGAAHPLMRASLDLAGELGYKRVILGVWEKNFRAQRFYSKWGFEKTGEKIFMVGSDAQTDWWFELKL